MQAIFVVLNKVECLDELLTRLKKAGVRGGTIIDSTGMVKSIEESDESYILGSLRLFLDNPHPDSKTIFFIVHDDQVELIRRTVDDALGGIDNPDTGIIFGIPVLFADGIIKK
jgi:hypothetical protein